MVIASAIRSWRARDALMWKCVRRKQVSGTFLCTFFVTSRPSKAAELVKPVVNLVKLVKLRALVEVRAA